MSAVHAPIRTPMSRAEIAARWLSLTDDVPQGYRAEMNEYGELLLSPNPANPHQLLAHRIARQLEDQLGGVGITAPAINTGIGVRIPDACWSSDPKFFDDDLASRAPEICVEVVSPSNTERELREKTAAYLEAGAREVIIVDLDGSVRFLDAAGQRQDSAFGLKLVVAGSTGS